MCAYGGGACQVALARATCPTGYIPIGGGYNTTSIDASVTVDGFEETGYAVIIINYDTVARSVYAQVVCLPGSFGAYRVASFTDDLAATRARFG